MSQTFCQIATHANNADDDSCLTTSPMRASNFYPVGKLAFRRHYPISLRGVLMIRKDTWRLVLAKTKDNPSLAQAMTSVVTYRPAAA